MCKSMMLLMVAVFCLSLTARAGEIYSGSTKMLVIGTKEAPPFSMKADDGTWSGISIDLWRQIAAELNYTFQFKQYDLRDLLQALETGAIDTAVAALTITSEREKKIDFTHSYYSTGLGIAIKSTNKNSWVGLFKSLLSYHFLKAIAGLVVLLFAVGFLVWLFERKKNPQQFGGGLGKGVLSGFWWSAVTMTTVGYGDKAPQTSGGRLIAVIWMFAAVITISTFTAAISSSLTVHRFESVIRGPEDLPRVRVGTIRETTSAHYLENRRIAYQTYENPQDGLRALSANEIDAFVYDAPLLRYLINIDYVGKLQVLPGTFQSQNYAFGLPPDSLLRESLNRVLLKKISDPGWQDTLYRYLGQR